MALVLIEGKLAVKIHQKAAKKKPNSMPDTVRIALDASSIGPNRTLGPWLDDHEMRSTASGRYDSKRARLPCDFSTETAFESKETNSSAPSHSPS